MRPKLGHCQLVVLSAQAQFQTTIVLRSSCLAEKRMLEIIADGKPTTSFMSFGDQVRIEMFDSNGNSIFGAIDQVVAQYKGA